MRDPGFSFWAGLLVEDRRSLPQVLDDMDDVEEQCLEAGMDGCMSRPLKLSELVSAVETYGLLKPESDS